MPSLSPPSRTSNLRACASLVFALGAATALGCQGLVPEGGDTIPTRSDAVADAATTRELPAGRVVGFTADSGAHAWLGIPFAEPPVGERRWRRARALAPWQGTLEALSYGSPCVQFASPMGGVGGEEGSVVGSEDCLALDVYAPAIDAGALPKAGERLPVMVWIHGGGNNTGAKHLYDGGQLASERQVIVVSVNYRLGPIGWLRHPALAVEADDDVEASGNFGTLDLVRSLEWVQTNIASFGGDPGKVTIFGESAGGLDVLSLLLVPQAKGLFHRAISQSGGPWTNTIAQAENWHDPATAPQGSDPFSSRELLARLAVLRGDAADPSAARTVVDSWDAATVRRVLRSTSAEDLLELYRDPQNPNTAADMPRVFRDGTVLPREPFLAAFEAGRFHRVPTILGTNRDEQKIFMAFDEKYVNWWFGAVPRVRDASVYQRDSEYASDLWKATGADEIAAAMARHQRDVWVYRFDWDDEPSPLGIDLPLLLGAAHGFEIDFALPGVRIPGVKDLLYDDDNAAGRQSLTDAMTGYWSSFAAAGDPGSGGSSAFPTWPRFDARNDAGEPAFLVLDAPSGGGVRAENGLTTTASVVMRAIADDRFDAQERCQRIDSLERNQNPSFRPEWRARAGCSKAVARAQTDEAR